MRKKILFALFLGVVLILAACSEDDTDQQVDSSSQEDSQTANQVDIIASNFELDPVEYTVNAGEEVKITLTNDEGMHGLAIDEFDVNIQGDGEATFTPDEPGEYTIYCNIPCGQGHAEMISTLIVQ
ncbi:cupredoxin domain-containing protein [Virgibacillus alimentarius]|uniref:Cytochrome c oxidase subunit 2 n=1 Tax=Virgibacillus alimentarius TaxID=698769 RepID=A0ABS4S5V2_9BACI|nr:cupredoxin domain-containing protein [Virgibacillus alimentarius]MBP2256878.1 cytochrome c oxidase subunit 2 [Virgibacillus alimentarius]